MTQPGNKFRFAGDPNDRVYQVVGDGFDEWNDAKNYSSLDSDWNENNNGTSTYTALQVAQNNSGPTLANILIGGPLSFTNGCDECDISEDLSLIHI